MNGFFILGLNYLQNKANDYHDFFGDTTQKWILLSTGIEKRNITIKPRTTAI